MGAWPGLGGTNESTSSGEGLQARPPRGNTARQVVMETSLDGAAMAGALMEYDNTEGDRQAEPGAPKGWRLGSPPGKALGPSAAKGTFLQHRADGTTYTTYKRGAYRSDH